MDAAPPHTILYQQSGSGYSGLLSEGDHVQLIAWGTPPAVLAQPRPATPTVEAEVPQPAAQQDEAPNPIKEEEGAEEVIRRLPKIRNRAHRRLPRQPVGVLKRIQQHHHDMAEFQHFHSAIHRLRPISCSVYDWFVGASNTGSAQEPPNSTESSPALEAMARKVNVLELHNAQLRRSLQDQTYMHMSFRNLERQQYELKIQECEHEIEQLRAKLNPSYDDPYTCTLCTCDRIDAIYNCGHASCGNCVKRLRENDYKLRAQNPMRKVARHELFKCPRCSVSVTNAQRIFF